MLIINETSIIHYFIFGFSRSRFSKIKKSNNEFIAMYVNWVILLVAVNLIIATFIYLFTHSVKKGNGNQGVRGKIGRRGEEGEPDYCNFCKPIGEIERDELLDKIDSTD